MFGQAEGGLLPALKNIVTGVLEQAAPIVSKYFEFETAKERAEAVATSTRIAEAQRAQAIAATQISPTATKYPVYGAQLIPGFDLASSWPILGIIGIGAFLIFRGRGKPATAPKKQRKR